MAVLLLDIYLFSFRQNIIIQIIFLTLLLISGRRRISVSFVRLVLPIASIFILGFVAMLFNRYSLVESIKDILHFAKPIVGLSVGYLMFQIIGMRSFLKTIALTGIITATVHIGALFFFSDFAMSSISDLRGKYFLDNYLEIFALIFVMFSKRKFGFQIIGDKWWRNFFLLLLGFSVLLYFSRTMFVIIILCVLSVKGYTKLNANSIRVLGLVVLFVGLLYAYLFSIKPERNSKGFEGFLYKVKIAPEEIFETRIDRDNHRDLWDHWRGYEAKRAFALMNEKPYSYVLGTGYGSQVNLKFVAPLGDEGGMRYISVLHNGYVFVIYKTGFVGLALLLLFLVSLYRYQYKPAVDPAHFFILMLISTIGMFYIFSSMIITGIYIPKDSVIFILGGLLYFEYRKRSLLPV